MGWEVEVLEHGSETSNGVDGIGENECSLVWMV